MFLGAGSVFAFHNQIGLRPYGVHVAFFHQVRFENVVLAPDDRIAPFAFLDRKDSGKLFIADP